jgi:hypothetical protein
MTKEDLLRAYEKSRDDTIQSHREEFLRLEERLENALNKLRKDFLNNLDLVSEINKDPVKDPSNDTAKKPMAIVLIDEEESGDRFIIDKSAKGVPKIQIKKGSKSAWNINSKLDKA